MASRSAKSKSRSKGSSSKGQGNARRASEKTEKYRFAKNVRGSGTVAEKEYETYATGKQEVSRGDPDVLLDVPVLKVDSIHLELDDLEAQVALRAKVLDLVTLDAGVNVHLGKLRIDIKGVEAQALLKVRLDHVAAIVDRVLTTIDRNPELVKSLGRTVEQVSEGAGHALGETGEAVEDVGEGAQGAVEDVGEGAGQAVGEIGEGAGQAAGEVGQGAGQAVGQVGEGAGQAVGNLDQAVGGLGQAAGGVAQGAGQAAGGLAGGGGNGGGEGGGGLASAGAGDIAKLAAKAVAKEIAEAAKEEAKELGLAAARKAKEAGERRKQRHADEHNATEAAMRTADELEVDLDEVDGTGPEGRITIRDVKKVAAADE